MLLQIGNKKNKNGLSMIIGYVLIMTVSIAMSVLVYQWIKDYVPKETLQCPDGVSIFVTNYSCQDGGNSHNLTLSFINNGRFSIDGYFIRASTDLDNLANIDLSNRLEGTERQIAEGIVRFSVVDNFFAPGGSKSGKFNVSFIGTIKKVELIPSRIELIKGFKRTAICDAAGIEIIIDC